MASRVTTPFFAYRSFNKELETVKRFYDAGIRQFCVFPSNTTNSLGQNYSEYPINWYFFHEYEFEHVDEQINDILRVAPEARLLFMVDLNSPYWLVRQHQWNLCDSMLGLTDALTTPVWRESVTTYLHDLLTHVEGTFPGRVEAYILACGQTDEWMDYSRGRELPCKLKAYKDWSKEHGWDEPANIPTFAERNHGAGTLNLRTHAEDEQALRFWRFNSEVVSNSIGYFAQEARKIIPDSTKLGCFFGYILELTEGRLVGGGHLGYENVFKIPELDFFISPGDYSDREMGGASGYMSPNGTIHLAGKNYFYEIDHRTSTGNMVINRHVTLPWMNRWPDEKADIAGLRREFCLALFHGASLWWFDMWGKFYESPNLLAEIAAFRDIHERLADPQREPEAEVAVIVDPASTYYVNDEGSGSIARKLYRQLMNQLNRLGAPFRTYSFNDVPKIEKLSAYRLVILPGLFEVTPEKRRLLEQYLLKDGRTVVWTYAAGIADAEKDTPDAMLELTGAAYGTTELMTVERNGWRSVFAPSNEMLTPQKLRELAAGAGVHLFTDTAEPIWYGGGLLMVHAVQSGPQTIRLRESAVPHILLGRPVEERRCSEFVYDFDAPETILVELR